MDVAVAIIERGQELLVGRRPPDVPWGGYWEFPGGKVRVDETPGDAVLREVREEVGFVVRPVELLAEVDPGYSSGPSRIFFYRCELLQGSVPREPFRWLPRAQIGQLKFPPANEIVLRRLRPLQAEGG